MKASQLIQTQKMTVVFEDLEGPVEDRTINVTVNPGSLTPAKQARLQAADEDDSATLAEMIADLISEWDLLGDDGEVIPLTLESLMNTPILVLAMVLNAVTEEFQAGASEEGKASVAT